MIDNVLFEPCRDILGMFEGTDACDLTPEFEALKETIRAFAYGEISDRLLVYKLGQEITEAQRRSENIDEAVGKVAEKIRIILGKGISRDIAALDVLGSKLSKGEDKNDDAESGKGED